ncbi:MAG: hypothetical protein F4Y00_01280 [Bacteroidetes bacterium SB0662_bin_6]|nr:hypothetical protein [Bacteroidetes bacterium SB0662_bin_6]
MTRFLLSAFLALFLVGAAQAQVTLVSNNGQSGNGTRSVNQITQQFATGDNQYGYQLTKIELHGSGFTTDHALPDPPVQGGTGHRNILPRNYMRLRDCTNSCDNILDRIVAEISTDGNTASFSFSPSVYLKPETKYRILTGGTWGSAQINQTSSNNQDSGGASGWAINDNSNYVAIVVNNNNENIPTWTNNTNSLKITVYGTVRTSFRSTPNNNTPTTPPVNTPPTPTVLSNPGNLQANFDKSTSSGLIITLSWNAVTFATDYEYKIFEGDPTNKVWPALIDWTSAGNVLETDVSLQSTAEDFTIWVRAKSGGQKSSHTQLAVYDAPDISSLSIIALNSETETPVSVQLHQNYRIPSTRKRR